MGKAKVKGNAKDVEKDVAKEERRRRVMVEATEDSYADSGTPQKGAKGQTVPSSTKDQVEYNRDSGAIVCRAGRHG